MNMKYLNCISKVNVYVLIPNDLYSKIFLIIIPNLITHKIYDCSYKFELNLANYFPDYLYDN